MYRTIRKQSVVVRQKLSGCVNTILEFARRYGWKSIKVYQSHYGSWYLRLQHRRLGHKINLRISDHSGHFYGDGQKRFELLLGRLGDGLACVIVALSFMNK